MVWVFEHQPYIKELNLVMGAYKKDMAYFIRHKKKVYKKRLIRTVKKKNYIGIKKQQFKKLKHFKPFTRKLLPDIFKYNPMSFTYNIINPMSKEHAKSLKYDAHIVDNFNIAFAYYLLVMKLEALYAIKYYQTFLKKSRPKQLFMRKKFKKLIAIKRIIIKRKRRQNVLVLNKKKVKFKSLN